MKPNDIIAIKLNTGEEIIGKYISFEGDETTFEKVRVIQIIPTGDGRASIGFLPFMLSNSNGQISISEVSIVALTENVDKELEDAYLQQTSGIQIAKGTGILGK